VVLLVLYGAPTRPAVALLRFWSTSSKDLEIVVLRHQLGGLRRRVRRPGGRPGVPVGGKPAVGTHQLAAFVVRPATLLRWHRPNNRSNSANSCGWRARILGF